MERTSRKDWFIIFKTPGFAFSIVGIISLVLLFIFPIDGRRVTGDFGSSWIPILCSSALILGGLCAGLMNLKHSADSESTTNWKRTLFFLLFIGLVIGCFSILGAFISFTLTYLVYLTYYQKSWQVMNLLFAFLSSIFTCLLFGSVLKIPLPEGLFKLPF